MNNKQTLLLIISIAALTFSPPVLLKTQGEGQLSADSVKEFSGHQGKHGWYYGYWNQSLDEDGVFDQKTDFEKFKQYGDDLINGLSRHTEFETGPLWYLHDGNYYTSVWATGGHAHADMELGSYAKADHWVVRRWISTHAGEVVIKGVFGKVMPWGQNWGGKVIYKIIVDDEVLFNRESAHGEAEYSLKVKLQPNSKLDFMIGPGSGIGVVSFTASVYKTE